MRETLKKRMRMSIKDIEDTLKRVQKEIADQQASLEIVQDAICDGKHELKPITDLADKLVCEKCGRKMKFRSFSVGDKLFAMQFYSEWGKLKDRELESVDKYIYGQCGCCDDSIQEFVRSEYYPMTICSLYRCKCGMLIERRQFRKFPHPKTEKEQENDE